MSCVLHSMGCAMAWRVGAWRRQGLRRRGGEGRGRRRRHHRCATPALSRAAGTNLGGMIGWPAMMRGDWAPLLLLL